MKRLSFIIAVLAVLAWTVSCTKETKSETKDTKFMVLSDIHFMHPDILKAEGKAFDKYNWEECKLLRESIDIFRAAIEAVRAERPDFVLVCGDMSKDGEVICHQYVADAFRQLEEETGTKVLVVPGNHDMNNPHSLYYDGDNTAPAESATEAKFEEIYGGLGYSEAVARRSGYLDYMSYPADGIAVICADSNEKNTAKKLQVQGGLSREQVTWITQMAAKAHYEGRHVLLMMHHNLVDFYDHAALIRGANIANARYDYTNAELIEDLCAAGVDVVFSGHSHMHSITSATSNGHTIYSVVTSSLVNLPLAYRCGTISEDGVMILTTSDLKDTQTAGGVNLRTEGDRYWMDLSKFYMFEAARVAWKNAGLLLPLIGFKSQEELQAFLDTRFVSVFYTFLTRTSDGDEHLVTPQENTEQAMAAVDGLIEYLDEQVSKDVIDTVLQILFRIDLDDIRQTFNEFFSSAYYNYLGSGPIMPDSEIVVNLTD